ncbi:snake venom 5'-nucleotidase-like isoform X2 [Clytia hemisphaerica]
MNYIGYDAMALGNHEFDNGPSNLVTFLQQANFSAVCSNMDVAKETKWPDPPIYVPSKFLERGGKKIGIIGYTTPDTAWLSSPGPNIKFSDPVESVRAEAQKLKAQGVNILIALGHAGYAKDQEIARSVKELDLVVGGHTDTFLWNGPQPSVEKVDGPYPFMAQRDDGTECPVVQDFTYGKYLGNLKLTFDENGKLLSAQGNPIMLNASYVEDEQVLKMVDEMDDPIIKARMDPIGRSYVRLEGDRSICRLKECNLGNFFADALVDAQVKNPSTEQWAETVLAIWNGGGIRSGNIDRSFDADISREELNTISPFGNTADVMEIKGKYLLQAFEHGFSGVETKEGRFPQVSGFRILYDKTKPVGSRLVRALALCNKCRVPKYEEINEEQIYKLVTSSYLADGGDGYTMLKKNEGLVKGEDALNALDAYFSKMSPVTAKVEGRVIDISTDDLYRHSSSSALRSGSINSMVFFLCLVFCLLRL